MFPIDQVALAALVRTEPFRIDDILPDLPMLSRDQVVRAPSRLSKRSAVRNLGRGLYSRGDAIEVEYCLNQAREAKTAEETHSLEMRGPIRALIRSAVADALEPLRGYVESAGDKIPSDVRKGAASAD